MLKNKKIILSIILFSTVISTNALAGSEELTVTSVKRIIPPDYRSSSFSHGVRDWAVWNSDNTKMMVVESSYDQHPVSGKTGRGIVWGTVADFKSWADTADYESKIKPIKPKSAINTETTSTGAIWDKTDPDILYVIGRNCAMYRYDTSTDSYSTVATNIFSPGESCTGVFDYPIIKGWTGADFTYPNRMMIMFEGDSWTYWDSYGVAFVATNGTIDYHTSSPISDRCSTAYQQLEVNWNSHGHGAANPNYTKYVDRCGTTTGSKLCVTDLSDCSYEYENLSSTIDNTHFSWNSSDDWWISNSGSPGTVPDIPTLADYYLTQSIYKPIPQTTEHIRILTQKSPLKWSDGTNTIDNYQAHFIATLRKDGKQVIFTDTDEKYSYEDCQYKPDIACAVGTRSDPDNKWTSSTWSFEGFYLVDLSPASGADTTPPAAPLNVSVQ